MSTEDEAGFEQMCLRDYLLANFSSEFLAAPATWEWKKVFFKTNLISNGNSNIVLGIYPER